MNIPALFIRRPVATSLLAIAIALSGLLAYFHLPVAPLPNVTLPGHRGAGEHGGRQPGNHGLDRRRAARAASRDHRRRDRAHLDQQRRHRRWSSSSSRINRDINGAARDVEAAIQAARADLPTTLRGNPSYREYNPADSPIIILALTSSTLTTAQLYDSADTVIQQQLSQITGVGQIQLGGSALPSVRVELEPDKLISYGIGLEDVRAAISSANADSAKGYIDQGDQRYEVMSNDQASKAARLPGPGHRLSQRRAGAAARCGRGGRLQREHPQRRPVQRPAHRGRDRLSAARARNIIKTVAQIKKVLPSVEATLPPNINVHIAIDRSQSVTAAVGDTERSLMIAVVLVIGVVFVFLQSPRATLIPAVVLPHLDPGHVRPDVPARLQHRQPVADGAHHRHRLRGRRCRGGAGERRAPRRIGHGACARPRCAAAAR